MSEERFARIENKLNDLSAVLDDLRTGQDGLRTGQHSLRAGLDELREGQHSLRAGLDELREGQHSLRTGLDELREGQDQLWRHMGVLHEEVIDRIKALAPDFGPIRREFTAADDRLRDAIEPRLTALEARARDDTTPR